MNISDMNGFDVSGFIIRTNNADEITTSTAKIRDLWVRFYENAAPNLNEESKVFGLYTNYESDFTGAFDVIACSDTLSPELLPDSVQVTVASGKYVTFSATGEMPQVVIELWGDVWRFFGSESCPYKRAYTTDFEYYKSASEVEISIAIK
ncbi:effector binding domain-containing protein [Vibrio cholerae]|uniref:GyrI-like domain-containing protein n=1 Tax=Vibrio cholerae TaxID=666 RepID=UPI0029AA31D9|nr:effector binding domain-containing protein [Vibrio cholerae]ELU9851487.1 effector binding domain-containing protein [Vibrio cholerae]ELV3249730.1 effector binding domain-containing protein [Vibrio cholerae]ELV3250302.1 effector binding domain-containing protein [Vibrio cholerae]